MPDPAWGVSKKRLPQFAEKHAITHTPGNTDPISGAPGSVIVEDEGVVEGAAGTIDFVGDGVSVTFVGTEATVTIPGGGSGTMTTVKEATVQVGGADIVTLDFGAGFDLTEAPDTEINIALDLSEVAAGGELAGFMDAPTVDATHSGSAHHNILTIGADAAHSLADQVLSAVLATAAIVGHMSTAAQTFAGLKTFGDGILTDTVYEETTDAGVTVEDVLLKDKYIQLSEWATSIIAYQGYNDNLASLSSGTWSLLSSEASPNDWTQLTNIDGFLFRVDTSVSISPYGGSLYRSTDGGASFDLVKAGGGGVFDGLCAPRKDANGVYWAAWGTVGGTSIADVYKSIDQGLNWTLVFHVPSTLWTGMDIACHPTDPLKLAFLAIYGSGALGVYDSQDGGATWTGHSTGKYSQIASFFQTQIIWGDSNRLFMSIGEHDGDELGYYSDDYGATWTATCINDSGSTAYNHQIIHGASAAELFKVWNTEAAGTPNGYISRSTDGGATWTVQWAVGSTVGFTHPGEADSIAWDELDQALYWAGALGTAHNSVYKWTSAGGWVDVTANIFAVVGVYDGGCRYICASTGGGPTGVANTAIVYAKEDTDTVTKLYYKQSNDTEVGPLLDAAAHTAIGGAAPHHAQSHDHSAAGDGTTLTPATLNLPAAAGPAQTADGQVVWDSDGNFLTVGDGASRQTFYPVIDATSDPLIDGDAAADGTEASVARKDHVHPKHHAAATAGADGEHTFAGQVLSGVAATAAQAGHATAAQITKLDGIEAGADVTDATNVEAATAIMDGDITPAEGFMRKTGAGAYTAHKSNLASAASPGVNDDAAAGYSVGSVWINTTLDVVWQCVDSTNGAAVWKDLSTAGGGGSGTKIVDADADTKVDVEEGADDDTVRIDVGGASAVADAIVITGAGGLVSKVSLIPNTDSAIDLGASDKYFGDAYIDSLYLNATAIFSGATAGVAALTGGLDVSGHLAVGADAAITDSYPLRVSESVAVSPAASIATLITGIGAGAMQLTYGISGIAAAAGTPSSAIAWGLYFAASHRTPSNMDDIQAIHAGINSWAAGTGPITIATGLYLYANWSGATPSELIAIDVTNMGASGVGMAYGLRIADQTATTSYLLELGSAPLLRLLGSTPGANQTSLYLAEGVTPTLRCVQWKLYSALVAADKVMVLV